MRFAPLQDRMAVMPFTLRCLRLFGLRGDRRNRVHFVLALLYRVVVIYVPKLVFGFRDRVDLVIRSISELFFECHIDLNAVLFAVKLDEFEELLCLLRKLYNKVKTLDANSPERMIIEASNLAIDKRSKSYVVYVAIACTIFFWVPVAQTTGIWILSHGSNITDRPEFVTMMELNFYGMDNRKDIVHYVIYAAISGVAHYYAAVYFALSGIVIFGCVKSIAALFDMVSARLAALHELSGRELREELVDLIELHVDGLRCIELLENINNLAMMVQMINCVLIWISMFLSISSHFTPEVVSLMVLLLVTTGETYVLCQLATELSQVSLTITDSIWNSNWIGLPVDVQKGLAMMLQRAQKKAGLTAAKFCFMDIERFARVAQSSYSVFVILKDSI
uniref:Odorant receptor n=1 Tax=Culex quinquefasciatus TaxID=7176 RepID=A0A3G1T0A1_CULQU|nr:odorant receptor 2 [Culex quinquefasciatus]